MRERGQSMTTRILKRYDISTREYLETLIDAGFKTVGQVVKLEKATQRAKNREITKILNIMVNIGSGESDRQREKTTRKNNKTI